MIIKKLDYIIQKHTLPILIIYGIVIRFIVFIFYSGVGIFPDSQNYIDLAEKISQFNLIGYTGERTPGFPSLIALCLNNLKFVIVIQSIFGILNIVLLYKFSLLKTKNKSISFLITLITTSFLHFIFYELVILTETLTITLMIFIFWFIEKFNLLAKNARLKHLFILSVFFSILYLTRPIFIYFPVGFCLFFFVKNYSNGFKKSAIKAFVVIIIPLITLYSWCSLNEKNIGYFTNTSYFGFNLSQTATSFFEKAPEKDKLIRDIFIKHRTKITNNNLKGSYPMTIWDAYPELLEKTKLSTPDLSNQLSKISIALFKEYPLLYFKQVVISWIGFWKTPTLPWNTIHFKSAKTMNIFVVIWGNVQKPTLLIINFLFLIFSLKKIITFKFRKLDSDLFLIAIVLSGSFAQALVAYGSNSRFCFPFFPFIVYFVLSNLAIAKKYFVTKK